MTNLALASILEKIISKDKDFRYMATSDLQNELQKDTFKADAETERRICLLVMQQLEDSSGDISALAVKCLEPLVKKVNETRVVDMVEHLCNKLLTGKEQQRSTATLALKALVASISSGQVVQLVTLALTPKLVNGINFQETSAEVKMDCMDTLCDLLLKFGNVMGPQHEGILDSVLLQLRSNKAGLRKRATQCLATLASSMSDDLLLQCMRRVLELLRGEGVKADMTCSIIQAVGALCRAVGYRFGPYLKEAVPSLIDYCHKASEDDDELREYSLQALESFVLRCPRDVTEHCASILDLSLHYISYDPNFTDDMEADEDADMEEEDEEEDSGDEYSDDEDVSWKVRRASAKCLSAVINSRPEMIAELYSKACPKLIERFREREENVKIDVFQAFIDLLRQTVNVTKGGSGEITPSSPLYMLKEEVGKIVRSLNKQLREKSVKTKVGAFCVLKELVIVLPNSLAECVPTLVPGIEKALNDRSSHSNLKIEALVFTRLVVASHPPEVFQPHVKTLLTPILTGVSERYYKVTAEALRVTGEVVKVMRPSLGSKVGSEARGAVSQPAPKRAKPEQLPTSAFDFGVYVKPIYEAVLKRLTAQDQDQEVKESAISCMGLVISILGDHLKAELPSCLPILLDRLRNEITRLTTVKAFATIAESPLGIDLSPVLEQVVLELTSFLRKANRALRQASLGTLNELVTAYGKAINASSYEAILAELSGLISDADLHLAALTLELCCTMMADTHAHVGTSAVVRDRVLPPALILVQSSLLQGLALQMVQRFFAALVQSASTSFDSLLESLMMAGRPAAAEAGGSLLAKQSYHSIAQCVAVLCLTAGDEKCTLTVDKLLGSLRTTKFTDAGQLLPLLCLGEIGRRKDLSVRPDVEHVIMEALQSSSEETKSAASFALGNIAVGNLSKYLPFILGRIDSEPRLQYLLLHSLKEVIARQPADRLGKMDLQGLDIDKVLALLFTHCESEEEGVRNVVAECLGKLALIEPTKIVPELQARIGSPSAFTRATAVTAVKYTIVDRPQPIDACIEPCIYDFLQLIKDEDRHVRRAAVSALSTAAHNKPSLVADHLSALLPLLYEQTDVKKSLIRTVDLGPFKHTVDDGLELRKTAFECVDTLLDACLDRIDASAFILPHLLSGLQDHYDVKMPCHLILSKLAQRCGPAVLAVIDALIAPLESTVTFKTKAEAVKQEVDRNEDMVRSTLRAIDALSRIQNIESSEKFRVFMTNVVKHGALGAKYNAVRHESDCLVVGDVMDMS